ncbi:hypothetical protein [Sorangium sp. So ce1024]|jgi:hypothetical protein|uniref:hypothetical protein n=1 Tax=unclassified Sorangium TaxID=2621164 RepID=UPI003EFF631D
MELRRPASPKEVVDAFYDDLIPWADVPGLLMLFINERNVDSIIEGLTAELRDYFIDHAEQVYTRDDLPNIIVSSSGRAPMSPPREAVLAVRGWLARHRQAGA